MKEHYQEILGEHIEELSALQNLFCANDCYSVLLIFQAGPPPANAIKHAMSGANPQGCEVCSFKQPSAEELQHGFLWRATRRLPKRERTGIFSGSHYEEVLIVRVHPAAANSGL